MDNSEPKSASDQLDQILEAAKASRQKNDLEAAARGYAQATKLAPEQTETWIGLARAQRDMGDLDSAEQSFQKAISKDSICFSAYLGLAGILTKKNHAPEAFELLAKASTKAKDLKDRGVNKVNVFFFLGEIELELNNLAEAVGFFEESCDADPANSQTAEAAGIMLDKAGYDLEAMLFYNRALELDPELAHIYNRIGISYRKQDKKQLALEFFLKALSFHPTDEHLIFNIARIYWEQGKSEDAMVQLREALKINPGFKLAQELFKMLDYQKHSKTVLDDKEVETAATEDDPESDSQPALDAAPAGRQTPQKGAAPEK